MSYHKNLFVFDIETIPDVEAGKRLLGIDSEDPTFIRQKMTDYHLEITDGKNNFLRQPFHKVVAVSCLEAEIINEGGFEFYNLVDIRSAGDILSSEAELINRFFGYLKNKQARLVSFGGKNFDIPVLKYAAMKHRIEAKWFYRSGDKWNNYQQKYSLDWHCDLIDAFSDFGASAKVKMNELCAAFSLPGKIDVDGSKVEEMFDRQEIAEIRNYCETDVLNTYLLYLVWQQHNGTIDLASFDRSYKQIIEFLEKNHHKSHWQKFFHKLTSKKCLD